MFWGKSLAISKHHEWVYHPVANSRHTPWVRRLIVQQKRSDHEKTIRARYRVVDIAIRIVDRYFIFRFKLAGLCGKLQFIAKW